MSVVAMSTDNTKSIVTTDITNITTEVNFTTTGVYKYSLHDLFGNAFQRPTDIMYDELTSYIQRGDVSREQHASS